MSGHHRFNELTKDFPPSALRRIDDMKRELLAEMPLHELRRARALTQRDMAKMLKMNQPAVSKLEQRTDIYLLKPPVLRRGSGRAVEDCGRVSRGGDSNHQLLQRGRG